VAKAHTICDGAVISEQDVERVEAALKRLADKEAGAPREITITIPIHVHHEYPKVLYKGKQTRRVQNTDEEAAAAKDGFGPYDHEAFTAKEGV
jgi:hypothetical protein